MGIGSIWHWLVVLAVIVLIFGTGKLKNMGSDLGAAVRNFKDGIKDDADEGGTADTAQAIAADKPEKVGEQVIEAETKEKV